MDDDPLADQTRGAYAASLNDLDYEAAETDFDILQLAEAQAAEIKASKITECGVNEPKNIGLEIAAKEANALTSQTAFSASARAPDYVSPVVVEGPDKTILIAAGDRASVERSITDFTVPGERGHAPNFRLQ